MRLKITEKVLIGLSIFFILVNLICPINLMAVSALNGNEEFTYNTYKEQLEENGVSKEEFSEWYQLNNRGTMIVKIDKLYEYSKAKKTDTSIDSFEEYINSQNELASKQEETAEKKEEEEEEQTSETTDTQDELTTTEEKSEIVKIIKDSIAKWYYIMRLIVIAFMLVLLIFIGIKMSISTIASEKAVYKQMLVDWVAGMILVFSIHYIMVLILNINDGIVSALESFMTNRTTTIKEEYEYGDEKNIKTSSEIETTLYESARTRAYSLKLTDGFTGMIIYGVLVYFAWRFAFMYLKRMINIMVLTLLAPAVSASYAFNKVITGKSKIFSTWFSEYIMNVIIQIIHAILYVSLVSMALELSLSSLPNVILAFVLLNFMTKADKLLRQLFKLSGGKGSLAGDMADKSRLQDLRNEIKGVGAAMMGGKITKMAAGATYRVVTKPARVAGEYAFGKFMEHRANNTDYLEKKKQEEKDEITQKKHEFRDLIRGKIETEESAKLLKERAELKEKIREAKKKNESEEKIEEMQEKNRQIEEKIADEYLKYEQRLQDEKSLKQLFKEGLKKAGDPTKYLERDPRYKDGRYTKNRYVWDEKKQKYKRRILRANRVGGNNMAFWRKKEDGLAKNLLNMLKWDQLLGASDDDKKFLQQEVKFWKSTITGVLAGIAGFPALVVEPAIGMGLLSKHLIARGEFKNRVRMVKNRPSYKKTDYYFKAFGPGAQKAIAEQVKNEINGAESKLTKHNMKKHSKLAQTIINTTTVVTKPIVIGGLCVSGVALGMGVTSGLRGTSEFTSTLKDVTFLERDRMNGAYQKKLRSNFKQTKKDLIYLNARTLSQSYQEEMNKYEASQNESASEKDATELMFKDKLSDENTIAIGDMIVEILTDDETNKFINKIDDMNTIEDKRQRMNQIKSEVMKNETKLIENAITKLCVSKGITDIENLKLDGIDNIEIQKSILAILEDRGIIKKGEIKLDDDLISDAKISVVYNNLSRNKGKANQSIEERLASDAILEYMAKENITDVKKLKENETKQEIYDIIKEKMMSDSSKSSADVISKLSGKDKLKEEINLSDFMKENVDAVAEKVKVTSKVKLGMQASKTNRKKLEKREVNRNVNEMKNRLEEYAYTNNDDLFNNVDEFRLAFLLDEVGKQNQAAKKAGINNTKDPERSKMKAKMEYYQIKEGSKEFNSQRDGSRRHDSSNDGNKDLTAKLKRVETKVHGPATDVIELINKI